MSDVASRLGGALADRYALSRELGGGGMSRVFLAEEAELHRTVVIKVIAPELAEGMSAERFTREVKVAARLQQANIVPVLSAGTADGLPYYTMPFVRGESLRARLVSGVPVSIADAVGILRDVGRALAYAHSEGVIHRDIKPENILLSGGAAVVTDFGIAKAVDASLTQEGAATTLTQAGAALGTPAYMAPEQALGDPNTDHRADLYSWGVVAWELLGGGHPFGGRSTMQAMMAAHVTEPAPSLAAKRPDASPALAALVMRCLEKDPAARPASAAELLGALEAASVSGERPSATPPLRLRRPRALWAAAAVVALGAAALGLALGARHGATPAADRSLAVLPFTSSGGDTANAYFAEGIADEVTNTLAQVPGVRLAGRSSAARFAGRGASAEEVGRTLRVGNVLDGSVRRAGNRIRVTAELSSTRDGMVLWHENYERPASDVFGVQDEIARAIAGQLQVTLAGAGAAASRGTSNLTAYDLYLHAMYLYRRRGPAITSAIADFEQATVLDSTFARAWAGLATALAVSPYYIEVRMGSVLPRARVAAERAVRLDSTLADAHLALGFVLGESYDFPAAEAEIKRAIAINPDGAEARYRLGWLYVNMGRNTEAIPTLQQARARDPVYFLVSSYLGLAEINVGQFDEGVAEEERAVALEPSNIAALSILTQGYARANRGDSAVAVARRIVAGTKSPARLGAAAFSLARGGHRAEADSVIRFLESLPADAWTRWSALTLAYTGTGDQERAIAAMQRAATGDGDLFVSYANLIAGELRPDPRIEAVWRRFHLDPARFATRPKVTQ